MPYSIFFCFLLLYLPSCLPEYVLFAKNSLASLGIKSYVYTVWFVERKYHPLFRRTLHPPLSTSHGIREFFVRFVKPGLVFPGPIDRQTLCVCKKPCFTTDYAGIMGIIHEEASRIMRNNRTVFGNNASFKRKYSE